MCCWPPGVAAPGPYWTPRLQCRPAGCPVTPGPSRRDRVLGRRVCSGQAVLGNICMTVSEAPALDLPMMGRSRHGSARGLQDRHAPALDLPSSGPALASKSIGQQQASRNKYMASDPKYCSACDKVAFFSGFGCNLAPIDVVPSMPALQIPLLCS